MVLWQNMFHELCAGPVAADQGVAARHAGGRAGPHRRGLERRGRPGQPAIAAYSAAKGAFERWAESMAGEIAPFGLGVTVLVAGTYNTDIITDAGTTDERDFDGPYARMHRTIDKRGRFAVGSLARPPEQFAAGLMRALDDRAPFRRRGGGRRRVDAVGFQPVSARRRYASGEPPRHGNPAPGRDARGCGAADRCPAADGRCRAGSSARRLGAHRRHDHQTHSR